MNKPVVAVCDQIRAIDKSRLLDKADTLSNQDIESLEESLKQVLVL